MYVFFSLQCACIFESLLTIERKEKLYRQCTLNKKKKAMLVLSTVKLLYQQTNQVQLEMSYKEPEREKKPQEY
jgi:UDP-N-acetylenolpyruvoylglucosamine reductase